MNPRIEFIHLTRDRIIQLQSRTPPNTPQFRRLSKMRATLWCLERHIERGTWEPWIALRLNLLRLQLPKMLRQ